MIVKLLAYTQNADAICAAAGNSCYSERPSFEIADGIDSEKVLSRIVGMGHHSVIEHAVFTFSVQGVSRALTHQLVRHRVASYSQQSQRYVSLDEPTYVTPNTVRGDTEAKRVFDETMRTIWDAYGKLESMGIPAEDARYLLPNGCTTNITITMNARELLHFFSLRCCNRAQWEIRELADRMLALCLQVSPVIFRNAGPPCVRGPCPEGRLSCGHPRVMASAESPFDMLCRVLESMDPETYDTVISEKSSRILPALAAISADGLDAIAIYADFILCAVAADGVLTEEEFALAKPVLDAILDTDMTYEDAKVYFHDYGLDNPEGYKQTMDAVVDLFGTISAELKDDIVLVCMMVCAVDGRISDEEKEWIRKLIA